MARQPTCTCGECRICKRREDKRFSRVSFDFSRTQEKSQSIGTSFSALKEKDFYFGKLPKNGRVRPFSPSS